MGLFNNNSNKNQSGNTTPTSGQSSGQSGQQGGSYNGIGNPSGGQSYNGIGNPSGGQAYNGIGNTSDGGQPYNGIGNTVQGKEPYNGIGNNNASQNNQQVAQGGSNDKNVQAGDNQNQNNQGEPAADGQNAKNNDQNTDGQQQKDSNSQNQEESKGDKSKQEGSDNQDDDKKDAEGKDSQEAQDGDKKESEEENNEAEQNIDINDLMRRMTQRSNKVFMSANRKAKELKSDIGSEHLLFGLIADTEVDKILTGMQIDPKKVDEELKKVFKQGEKNDNPAPTQNVKVILSKAMDVAKGVGLQFISPEHILSAMADSGKGAGADVLKTAGVKKEALNEKLAEKGSTTSGSNTKKGGKTEAKSYLQQFTTDVTAKAEAGQLNPVIGRHEQIERTIHVLSRRMKNNPCMVGEPGTGKTAIVEGLAQRIVNKEVPDNLVGKRMLSLEINSIIAGASHRGEFEERLKGLVDELKNAKGEVILFIDEIHTVVGAGGEGGNDASNFLKPAMARGEIQLVGATTIAEFRKYIEKDPALERRFQKVFVPEPTEEESIKMLQGAKSKFEEFHKVRIPDEAIESCVVLSKRYIGDRYLPDKAFDLMDEAAAAVHLPLLALPQQIQAKKERVQQLQADKEHFKQRGENVKAKIASVKIEKLQKELDDMEKEYTKKKSQTTTSVTPETVKDIISQKSGVPVSKMADSEGEKLSKLEDIMHERMIGQERAVSAVAQAVRRGRSGLKAPGRPIGGFVFLGPSGTGKTELAKTLAEVMFGQEDSMIRFDMTEYMEKHEVAKLLGPPPGYVGYEEGGKLTNAVRMRPYCVVLFDEVEKAHPDIFNILLQVLDDGRLTDNKGRVVSFKDAVVICTSNVGAKMIQKELLGTTGGGLDGESEEAPVTTYAVAPDGSEIVSLGSKVFLRGSGSNSMKEITPVQDSGDKGVAVVADDDQQDWEKGSLEKYFAEQSVSPDSKYKDAKFPVNGYDTHIVSPDGIEYVTKDNYIYIKNDASQSVWDVQKLEDYFADSTVKNAKKDVVQQQLPTKALRTHAFSPDGLEYVTYGDRMWKRQTGSKEWETLTLNDYFKDQNIENGKFPTSSWDVHVFMRNGEEVITVGEKLWHKDDPQQPNWTRQEMKDFFGDEYPLKKGHIPSTYTLLPAGKEIITVHNNYYSRGAEESSDQDNAVQDSSKQVAGSTSGVANDAVNNGQWEETGLKDYFAGQTVVPSDPEQTGNEVDFPDMGYDTHLVTPEGKEMISKDNILYFRDSVNQAEWKATTLGAYFHENQVVNAAEGAQDQQLPSVKLNTHAISPNKEEIVTFRDRFWRRTGDAKEWQTGFLKDYFVDQQVDKGSLPVKSWNIHLFTAQGKEVIVSGEGVYERDTSANSWKRQDFKEYFNDNAPGSVGLGEDEEVDEEQYNRMKDAVKAELMKFFRPELVNRFDAAIVFEPLRLKHVKKIARLNLKSLNKLLMEQEMTIQFTESAIKEIAIEGYDPMFGARPLRRSIQALVEDPLSEKIIAGEVKSGDMITVDYDGEKMTFHAENAILLEESGAPTDQPINFTPLVVDVFIEEHFSQNKEELMKKVEEINKKFPKEKSISDSVGSSMSTGSQTQNSMMNNNLNSMSSGASASAGA